MKGRYLFHTGKGKVLSNRAPMRRAIQTAQSKSESKSGVIVIIIIQERWCEDGGKDDYYYYSTTTWDGILSPFFRSISMSAFIFIFT